MGKLVGVENVTLDGVMQAPGRCDEDRRGGSRTAVDPHVAPVVEPAQPVRRPHRGSGGCATCTRPVRAARRAGERHRSLSSTR